MAIDPTDPEGHILFDAFGRAHSDEPTAIDEFLKTAPVIYPVAGEIITRNLYDEIYGLRENRSPLDTYDYSPKEDTWEDGPLMRLIREYAIHNIKENFGISLNEYLNLPPFVSKELVTIGAAQNKARSKEMHKVFANSQKD